MNADLWQSEAQRFLKMTPMDQVSWLSCLLWQLTISARGTYQIGTDQVENPVDLRRFNELMHRISEFQMQILLGKFGRMSGDELFNRLKVAFPALRVSEEQVFEQIIRLTSRHMH